MGVKFLDYKTKIVCTIGPASRSETVLEELMRRGMNVARLNFAHGTVDGRQTEESIEWAIESYLEEIPKKTFVTIEGRTVHLRSWKYEVNGIGGFGVPVYFVDSNLPENSEWDRTLTHFLYGGDQHYRLYQEVILGIGGVRGALSGFI